MHIQIVFPFRILALENNFLLQFQIDVSVISILFTCLMMQMNANADLIVFHICSYIHIFIIHILHILRIISFPFKASSKGDRKKDFDKIFAHYDVVSML